MEHLVEQRGGRVLSVFAVSSAELQEWWVYIALRSLMSTHNHRIASSLNCRVGK